MEKITIGIITALTEEYVAMEAMLENRREGNKEGRGAGRRYLLGEIPANNGSKHGVVLALADEGNNSAANRATLLLQHYPSVNFIVIAGIAGGVPHPKNPDEHVRLGDIVVSNQKGVVQYDYGKETITEHVHRNPPRPPSAILVEASRHLEIADMKGDRPWIKFIDQATHELGVSRPSEEEDILHDCPDLRIISHPKDGKRLKGQPRVFAGSIASANIVLTNCIKRDALRDKFGVKAFEMESSGIADVAWNNETGYFVVRGTCDYCDGGKNDVWHRYASIVAAAYTRALLESMPAQDSSKSENKADQHNRERIREEFSKKSENKADQHDRKRIREELLKESKNTAVQDDRERIRKKLSKELNAHIEENQEVHDNLELNYPPDALKILADRIHKKHTIFKKMACNEANDYYSWINQSESMVEHINKVIKKAVRASSTFENAIKNGYSRAHCKNDLLDLIIAIENLKRANDRRTVAAAYTRTLLESMPAQYTEHQPSPQQDSSEKTLPEPASQKGIPQDYSDLWKKTMSNIDVFNSDTSLGNVFMIEKLAGYHSRLPNCDTKLDRIKWVLTYFWSKRFGDKQPVLHYFLQILHTQIPEDDSVHDELNRLSDELSALFNFPVKKQ